METDDSGVGAENVVDAEAGLLNEAVEKDCGLQGLGVSEILVSGRIGILNSDFGDRVGRVDESCTLDASMAGLGIAVEDICNCAGEMLG